MPYWEYSIDSAEYGRDWAEHSPIFSKEMFGTYPTESSRSHVISPTESDYLGNIEL